MPANASAGAIRIVTPVIDAVQYAFSTQDDMAAVQAIPPGGTELVLPANPSAGDEYSWGDVDGSCSSTKPLTLVAQGSATVRGGGSFAMTSPFSAGKVVFDAANDSWSIVALTSSAATPGGAALFGSVQLVPAGTTETLARANVQTLWLLGANNALTLPLAPVDGDVVVLRLLPADTFFGTLAANGKTVEPPNQMGTALPLVNVGQGPATLIYQFSAGEEEWACVSNSVEYRPVCPWSAIFVDPGDVTPGASDQTPNPTSAAPIITIAELNRRLLNNDLVVATTITYLSGAVAGDALLDLSTTRVVGAGSLTIQGTPTVVHSGTTFTGVTAINPSAAGGGQSQTVTDTGLGSFAPFQFDLIQDTTSGAYAWISKQGTTTVNASKPLTHANGTGAFAAGDAYQIQTQCNVGLAALPKIANSTAAISVTINDCNLAISLADLPAPFGVTVLTFNRCSFAADLTPGPCAFPTFNNCRVSNGLSSTSSAVTFLGGLYSTAAADGGSGNLVIGADTYVTGAGLFVGTSGQGGWAKVTIQTGLAGSGGVQIQGSTGNGVTITNGGEVIHATGSLFAWGTGNATLGVQFFPGSNLEINNGDPWSVTGTSGDFAFVVPNGEATAGTTAYQIGVSAGAVTATSTVCSWANLQALAGGKNLQRPDANSGVYSV
jgi:hypothetical protein